MIKQLKIVLFLGALTTFFACQESYYYSQSHKIDGGWEIEEKLQFPFSIEDTSQYFNLYMDVDHTRDFLYQNLYINIITKYPDQNELSDTLSFDLANKTGDWNGKCNNSTCDLRVFLANKIKFEQAGEYTISINPFGRPKSIEDINQVSLRLEKYADGNR